MQYKWNIAVNTRLLLKDRLEGIGYFTHETLKRITRQHKDVRFWLLFDRPFSDEFIYGDNVQGVSLFPQARHPFLYVWWFEWSMANWLNQHQPDLYLSPDGHCSLRSAVPQLAVMHDLAFLHYPQHMSKLQYEYFKFFMPKFANHAMRIATVSEYSKQDIIAQYNIDPQKIDVVYSGVKDGFAPVSHQRKQEIQSKFSSGKKYFVYVGSINPRKNVANLLRAFDVYKQQMQDEVQFVIAGANGWKTSEIFEVYQNMQHKGAVHFTGRLEVSELVDVIASADVALYVSLFEGFGVPPLEAMACGVPVITSNVSSMPEVSGPASLLASPMEVNDIADKMMSLMSNEQLKSTLAAKGLAHHRQYTWDRTAELLWQSCLTLLNRT